MAQHFTDLKGNATYWLENYKEPARPAYHAVVTDTDEFGRDIEQVKCTAAIWERFVDSGGNICEVPLATCRVLQTQGPEGSATEHYMRFARATQLRNGSFPLDECPYATNQEYRNILGRDSLISPIPAGVTPCTGKEGGCEHMHALIEKRRELKRKNMEKKNDRYRQMSQAQMEAMAKSLGAGIADAMRDANPGQSARQALRTGKGEKSE